MEKATVTTAAIVSFCEELEEISTAFYENVAARWPESKETFLAYAKDGTKNRLHVVRTYQETISDAYEASYSFEGFVLSKYALETALVEDAHKIEGLTTAIALEEKACAFYLDVAERSESLLATIPRAFKRVAKKRTKRKQELETLLEEAKAAT